MKIEESAGLLLDLFPFEVKSFVKSILENKNTKITQSGWNNFESCQIQTNWSFDNIINLKFHTDFFKFAITVNQIEKILFLNKNIKSPKPKILIIDEETDPLFLINDNAKVKFFIENEINIIKPSENDLNLLHLNFKQ